MLNILKKKPNFYDKSLNINLIKNDSKKISVINESENIIYYPSASKEWFNNVYNYNKSYSKPLVVYGVILNKLFSSYCNMVEEKNKKFYKRRRPNNNRYWGNKIYISRSELKHNSTKVNIVFYLYNRQKISIAKYLIKIISLTSIYKVLNKNELINLKNNPFVFKKWHMTFFKLTDNIFRYLVLNFKKTTTFIRLLDNLFTIKKIFFNYAKSINFNKSKFNNIGLNLRNLGLISLIQKIYNKKVEIKLVELKSLHLNSDVFSSAVVLKLRDRKNNAFKILKAAIINMVKIPDLHTLITFDDNIEMINKNNVINTMKQQVVSGVRFEASGRLTKRLTAMRAVFKYKYLGSLKNIRSSFNKKPSTMLRGYVKSNSQYININSKTRNGTFGLKGWVSSH